MKLFIVTRSDLAPGARVAQSVHAALQYAHEHRDATRTWFESSNNLVALEAPDEPWLVSIAERARAAGVPVSVFREPDFGDAVTAIALGPAGARLVSSLPLALRPPKSVAA